MKIAEFLSSDYLEVRFAAIVNITKFFEKTAKSMRHFHLQELMFVKLYENVSAHNDISTVLTIF